LEIRLQGQLIGIVGGKWNPGHGDVLKVSDEIGNRHIELGNAVLHVEAASRVIPLGEESTQVNKPAPKRGRPRKP
jgi:hypothetical protein